METEAKKHSACLVRYCPAGKLHRYGTGDLDLAPGDRVVVDLEPGQCLARVVSCMDPEAGREPPKRVFRHATDEDLAREQRNRERGEVAYRYCRARVQERGLPMRLVKVEYLFDGGKAVFYFTAEGRVDFRDLVKDLTRELNTRIEMRQIGVRDAAKQLGGHGPCGQELCCATWLVDFNPVSVRMAKDQNLSLNPSKLSGVCGRLKCCLAYEHETYQRLKTLLPKLGGRYESEEGVGKVIKQDVLGLAFTVVFEDGHQIEVQIPQPETLPPLPAQTGGGRPRGQSRGPARGKAGRREGAPKQRESVEAREGGEQPVPEIDSVEDGEPEGEEEENG